MTLRYSKDHEWVSANDDRATIGISVHAQNELGEIIFVELPEVGREVVKGDTAAVIESVKAASDVYMAVSGTVVEINHDLENDPGLINASPEADGWLFRVTLKDPGELDGLMDAAAYKNYLANLG